MVALLQQEWHGFIVIKMIRNAINERATKKGILIEDLDQNDMDEILNELGIPDVEIITIDSKK